MITLLKAKEIGDMSHSKFNNIETERLILRRFRDSDAPIFLKYRTNPQVAMYQGEGWEDYTMEKAKQFVNEMMNSEPGIPDTWFQIAIELKSSGALIGDCAIHTLLEDTNQVEIGYTIAPEYQNQGLAADAVRCLLDFVFTSMNKHRVIAVTDTRNIGSVKLLEKIGMRREGHFIKNAWYRGEYTDEYLYAILKEEWQRSQRA